MPGIAELALGAAPIAGGALLGVAAGNLKAPDVRGLILKDMDMLERIPDDQPELKARLKESIDQRINDLIVATQRSRELRLAAASYRGNWRDVVLFVCSVLFTIIWWNVKHDRPNWLVLFIALIVLSLVTAIYAVRGVLRAMGSIFRNRGRAAKERSPRLVRKPQMPTSANDLPPPLDS
jgi:hypothetical protein